MLEALVSSRIRRTLFEYLLSHASDRFYLRSLAKKLQLSVSPLRRELKRLERSGMLAAVQEGNILFYTVNTGSPAFLQLQRATQLTKAPSPVESVTVTQAVQDVSSIPQPLVRPEPVLVTREAPVRSGRTPLRTGILMGLTGLSMALMALVVMVSYLSLTNQRPLSRASQLLRPHKTEVTVVVPPTTPSGAMRGARWQLVPGNFGGFSTSSNRESYRCHADCADSLMSHWPSDFP